MKIIFDENFSIYLAKGFAEFQSGRPEEDFEVCHLTEIVRKGQKDEDWLPEISKLEAVVLTQDYNIYATRHLRQLLQENKIGIFFFRSPKKSRLTYWDWIREVMKAWQEIKELTKAVERPFSYEIKQSKISVLQ